MTGLPVEQRFENHKKGQKSAWVVRKYGLRLMPELYGFLNPMPFEAAAQMEEDLADVLTALGASSARISPGPRYLQPVLDHLIERSPVDSVAPSLDKQVPAKLAGSPLQAA
jgi:hypothetical protein